MAEGVEAVSCEEFVDRSCEGVETESLHALISIATKCVSSSPDERPTMHRVVQLLESDRRARTSAIPESVIAGNGKRRWSQMLMSLHTSSRGIDVVVAHLYGLLF